VVAEAFTTGLCSEHFSVDGTLIESFASAKSFQPRTEEGSSDTGLSTSDSELSPPDGIGFKPSSPDVDFDGEKRTNETLWSRTDPEAKLYRKKIKEVFGWLKEVAEIGRSRLVGRWKLPQM
jgi:hypothetical protein